MDTGKNKRNQGAGVWRVKRLADHAAPQAARSGIRGQGFPRFQIEAGGWNDESGPHSALVSEVQ